MSLRLSLFVVLAVAGCARQAPQARAPRSQPVFDLSRICDDPRYGSVCSDTQAPAPAALPATTPIRVDTNLTAPSTHFGLQG